MLGTLVSLVIALAVYFSGIGGETITDNTFLNAVLIGIPLIMLFFSSLGWIYSWQPIQQAEQHLTSRVSELFRKDVSLRFTRGFFVLFLLLSVLLVIDLWYLHLFSPNLLLLIWFVLVGMSIDVLNYQYRRISGYLDPFKMVTLFTHHAQISIQNDNDLELCEGIDALAEVGVRAVERTSISLANTVCNGLQRIGRIFLESSKSIGHSETDVKMPGGADEVSYTLIFLLQRLEMINNKAAEQRLETVCSNIATTVGKIVLAAAKCDISLIGYPIRCLGKFAVFAESNGLLDVGTRATLTLLAVARGVINENDVTYAELQDPFCSLVAQMKEIAKEMFRNDKSISIKLLTQPFRDLRELFTSEKMSNHPDTPVILRHIDAALAEFEALESVMKALPPIPTVLPDQPG
jgi:hypothetical protein